jgi:hypothetical protein
VLGLIIDVKKESNVCVNISESGMMIKKYFGIAQNTIGLATQPMRSVISALYGKTRTALSSKMTALKDYILGKRM